MSVRVYDSRIAERDFRASVHATHEVFALAVERKEGPRRWIEVWTGSIYAVGAAWWQTSYRYDSRFRIRRKRSLQRTASIRVLTDLSPWRPRDALLETVS